MALFLAVETQPSVSLGIGQTPEVELQAESVVYVTGGDHYEGPYTVTPSDEIQTLSTEGFLMDGDVVVYAIESLTEQEIISAVNEGGS